MKMKVYATNSPYLYYRSRIEYTLKKKEEKTHISGME